MPQVRATELTARDVCSSEILALVGSVTTLHRPSDALADMLNNELALRRERDDRLAPILLL